MPHIEESKRRMSGWTKADAARVQEQWAHVRAEARRTDRRGRRRWTTHGFRRSIAEHYRWVCNFWTPNRESYTGLGQLYVDSPDFKVKFDAAHPRPGGVPARRHGRVRAGPAVAAAPGELQISRPDRRVPWTRTIRAGRADGRCCDAWPGVVAEARRNAGPPAAIRWTAGRRRRRAATVR